MAVILENEDENKGGALKGETLRILLGEEREEELRKWVVGVGEEERQREVKAAEGWSRLKERSMAAELGRNGRAY